jgi:hypothetical protein
MCQKYGIGTYHIVNTVRLSFGHCWIYTIFDVGGDGVENALLRLISRIFEAICFV